jgi:uncharacterized protein YbjT (DUF2867 family)
VFLVTGSTGNVGGALVRALHGDGVPVRALARDPARTAFPDGVEVVAGDLTRPAEWADALRGVEGIFLLSGYDGMTELLALAREAGVRRAVLLSSSSLDGEDWATRWPPTTRRRRPTSARPASRGPSCGRTAS